MTRPDLFIWDEFLARSLDPALAFHGEEMGWPAQESGMPGQDDRIVMGPRPVPGDPWMIQALDPQGAGFAVLGPRA